MTVLWISSAVEKRRSGSHSIAVDVKVRQRERGKELSRHGFKAHDAVKVVNGTAAADGSVTNSKAEIGAEKEEFCVKHFRAKIGRGEIITGHC